MPTTWSGWQAQFLTASPGLVTPPNMDFLTEWHKKEPGGCNFNPVTLSTVAGGSSRCGDTVAGFGRTQNYPNHGAATTAWRLQLNTPRMKALRAALNTGNPYDSNVDRTPVAAALRDWGSPTFARWYANGGTMGGGSSSGGGTGGLHKGWDDLRKTINKTLPGHNKASKQMTTAALRQLARARKVKL